MALEIKLNGNMVVQILMACLHIHTCSQSHLGQIRWTRQNRTQTVERVNIGYKGNNIQLQRWHIKERRWKKGTVKNIKIDRIKSEDIVADIKDTILHCQLFKVWAPLFFDSMIISSICNLKMHQRKNKLLKNPLHFPGNHNKTLNKCQINMIIKNILV